MSDIRVLNLQARLRCPCSVGAVQITSRERSYEEDTSCDRTPSAQDDISTRSVNFSSMSLNVLERNSELV